MSILASDQRLSIANLQLVNKNIKTGKQNWFTFYHKKDKINKNIKYNVLELFKKNVLAYRNSLIEL